jgi:glutamate synthase (NADPH/NADH) large chain
MSGGLAFVMDERIETRVNPQMVRAETLTPEDLAYVQVWVQQHAALTGSPRAAALLAAWDTAGARFTKIVPKDQPTPVLPIPVELPALSERLLLRTR